MTATESYAIEELAVLRQMHSEGVTMFSAALSQVPRSHRGLVYRLLKRKGLIVEHEDSRRYTVRMWRLSERAIDLRPGEEASAILG